MTDIQKAPWNRLAEEASRTYQAQKKVTPAKSAVVKKSTAKKVVKKSTKTAKVSVSTARLRYAVI